jgi:hypothetical protein
MDNTALCQVIKPEDGIASYDAATIENPQNRIKSSSSRPKRSIGKHTKFWAPGRTLKIAFLNGDQQFKDTVKAAAAVWEPHVNLTFDFVEGTEGEIRIRHNTYSFYASTIGTDALLVRDPENPTMHIATDYWWDRCVPNIIHEFGHMLGLEHEHLHPEANIPWDKASLYKDRGVEDENDPTYNQTKEKINEAFLNRLDPSEVNFSPYDSKSIMHYEIKQHWTLGDFTVAFNYTLSDADKAFVSNAYPHHEVQNE